jgi:formylglycine-generating enzyme required for sulfatase activity
MFLAVLVWPGFPQQANPPLSKDQVMDLLKFGMESTELAKRIKERGIDFEPTDDYIEALRKAGAQEPVIQALREAKPKPLTREQVGKLIVGGVPSERAAALVRERGIDFQVDDKYLDTLRVAGADDTLIAALREASKAGLSPGQIRENPKDGLKYVWIPLGTFTMGCSPGDNECEGLEKPAHQVTITRGFWIGQTLVTVAAYKRFAGAAGRAMPSPPTFNDGWTHENMPIVNVIWDDAQAYCGWMGGRLPTEAEWEYAARAGSREPRYAPIDEVAWYNGNSSGQTHDVAGKRPNGFGLYDVLGNVREWVADWYDTKYEESSPAQDPQGPASGQFRVLRGGAWDDSEHQVRVTHRFGNYPTSRYSNDGFRCAREAAGP